MPIDLTHKFIALSGLGPQSFTGAATLSEFVTLGICTVISSYYHGGLALNLEN